MKERYNPTNKTEFYKSMEQKNPSLILGLIIITLGLYIINWIYIINKDFEEFHKHAPDSKRGAVLLMILPFLWFFVIQVFKFIFFSPESIIVGILEITGFGIIYFLIMKYLLDFCLVYGEITMTSGPLWFLLLFLGSVGIISTLFNFYWLTPLILFIVITIPAMQAELNTYITNFKIKKERVLHYH